VVLGFGFVFCGCLLVGVYDCVVLIRFWCLFFEVVVLCVVFCCIGVWFALVGTCCIVLGVCLLFFDLLISLL